jgi:hypothetical protein
LLPSGGWVRTTSQRAWSSCARKRQYCHSASANDRGGLSSWYCLDFETIMHSELNLMSSQDHFPDSTSDYVHNDHTRVENSNEKLVPSKHPIRLNNIVSWVCGSQTASAPCSPGLLLRNVRLNL